MRMFLRRRSAGVLWGPRRGDAAEMAIIQLV